MEEREICDLHGVSLVSYTPPQIVKTGKECLVKMKIQNKKMDFDKKIDKYYPIFIKLEQNNYLLGM